ncbi:MAG: histidine phosphatase family protein [Actinomycetota bacterium]
MRHGATDWNDTKRAQGWADVELNDKGRKQAIAAARELSDQDIDAVYSSDLRRAVDTARPIAEVHEVEVGVEPAFREIDQGEWTGLTTDEIARRWPDLWGPNRHHNARPGGESPTQVRTRSLARLKEVIESHSGDGGVVVVSHGGTIRWLSAEALGFDEYRSRRIRGVGNGAVVCMDARVADGRLVLENLTRWDGNTTDLDDPND